MRAYVFTDAALAKQAGRFVWLSIDTEKEKNADFLTRYPMEVWPTLFIVDAEKEAPVMKWLGSANASELSNLRDDGMNALAPLRPEGEAAAIARADRLGAEGKGAEAVAAYREALRKAPHDKRPRLIESLVLSLMASHELQPCAEAAITEAASMPRDPAFANTVATGLYCAEAAGESAAWSKDAIGKLRPLVEEAVGLPGLLADDRSGLYEVLVDARQQAGDAAGAQALAGQWLAFLDGEARKARDPEARAAFDPARVLAASRAGQPGLAIPALEQSERDLPDDYNAAARLAQVYQKLGRTDDALAAVSRALAKGYGPRQLRLLELKSDLLVQKGDRAAARAALEQALKAAEALPAAQHRDESVAHEKARLAQLDKTPQK